MCLNIGNFYLTATLDRYEYMKMPISLFPPWIVDQYDLNSKVVGGYIYLQLHKAVWGLPLAEILANKLLQKCLAPHGYYECKNTPGFWKHTMRPITLTLIVDDFGVKYERQEDVDHLIAAIKTKYILTKDWTGGGGSSGSVIALLDRESIEQHLGISERRLPIAICATEALLSMDAPVMSGGGRSGGSYKGSMAGGNGHNNQELLILDTLKW
jgi:hypothetical protein